jgi:hypothetical protein
VPSELPQTVTPQTILSNKPIRRIHGITVLLQPGLAILLLQQSLKTLLKGARQIDVPGFCLPQKIAPDTQIRRLFLRGSRHPHLQCALYAHIVTPQRAGVKVVIRLKVLLYATLQSEAVYPS